MNPSGYYYGYLVVAVDDNAVNLVCVLLLCSCVHTPIGFVLEIVVGRHSHACLLVIWESKALSTNGLVLQLVWPNGSSLGLEMESKTVSTPYPDKEEMVNENVLDDRQSTLFRAVTARLNYLAQDRMDIQFSAN